MARRRNFRDNPGRLQDALGRDRRYMEVWDDNELAQLEKAMLAKDEMYDIGLFPDRAIAALAEDQFNGYRTGMPAMQAIGDDMRNFYGIAPRAGLDKPRLTNLPPEIETKLVEMFPESAPAAPTPPAPVPAPSRPANNTNQYSSPIGPEQLKQDYVQDLSGLTPDQQLVIDTSLKTDLGRDLDQALLWGSLALAAGGTGGFAAGTANEQNNMTEHEEAMLYALSHA